MDVSASLPPDLETPYAAVDLDVLDRNLRTTAASIAARRNRAAATRH
jgi:hypothetical protein